VSPKIWTGSNTALLPPTSTYVTVCWTQDTQYKICLWTAQDRVALLVSFDTHIYVTLLFRLLFVNVVLQIQHGNSLKKTKWILWLCWPSTNVAGNDEPWE
jgi:hypothetical protein